MTTKVGINGFGRIGRQVLKAMKENYRDEFDVVAVNDLFDPETNAHLFKYDSNFGIYSGTVEVDGGDIVVDGDHIKVLAERDPAKLPWGDLGAEIVFESTGVFRDGRKAAAHISAGAKKVIISAPAKPADSVDLTVVLGVNDEMYDPAKHHILSNASCTTNCLAPVAKVLQDTFGIEKGLMTTIHAYTNDQQVLDLVHKDPRRARAAALNIIPTSTGAAKAIGLVVPELKGKLDGMAMRVPVGTGSAVDLTCALSKSTTAQEVNAALEKAANGKMKGFLEVTHEPIVSSDVRGYPVSSVVDGSETKVVSGNLAKVISWYDNEWAYSCRLGDLVEIIARTIG
ncbi:MAG: type I glyceraldehyde-3-phosphate dehydrogenase [Phycisphaerae bacterium]|nr:type I glyceraldehyde-3-phosphate dehydrogenase [Phycisphaerae bacterium]